LFKNRLYQCQTCHEKRRAKINLSSSSSTSSILSTIGSNAVSLVQSLPSHSHHKAPLLHFLSKGITSTNASEYFNISSSYIRECKRKNQEQSDLLIQKYSSGVKRQKLSDETINHIMNYLIDNCPTKSGSSRIEYRQYINDYELYDNYLKTKKDNMYMVSISTFIRLKKWLRVKKIKSYWGQFDCILCLSLKKLKPEWMNIHDENKLNNLRLRQKKGLLRNLLYHRMHYFHNTINIK
jgi:hypothetical protein